MKSKLLVCILACATLTTACSSKDSNDGGSAAATGQQVEVDPKLTPEEFQKLADADTGEQGGFFGIADLPTQINATLNKVGDFSNSFLDLNMCTAITFNPPPAFGSTLALTCAKVSGSIVNSFDIATFSSTDIANLTITGNSGTAAIKRERSSSFMMGPRTRKIDDVLTINGNKYVIKGDTTASLDMLTQKISITGTLNISKNDGTAEVVTITSSSTLAYGACGMNNGSVTYAGTRGNSVSINIPPCPAPPI